MSENEEWNGEGLPPVGCECEYKNYDADTWERCEILAHKGDSVVFWSHEGFVNNYIIPESFRPIKSKQEIERDAEIDKMLALDPFTGITALTSKSDFCHKLIDAGYRKLGEEVGANPVMDILVNSSNISNGTIAEMLCDKFKIYLREES